jgi:hypothetical protein
MYIFPNAPRAEEAPAGANIVLGRIEANNEDVDLSGAEWLVRIHVVGREGRRAATATAGALIVLRGTRGEGSRRARGQALSAGWGNRLGGADLSIQAVTA